MDFVRTIKQKTARGLPRQSFGEECFGEADPFLRRNLFAKQQQAKRFEESFSERNWFSLKSIFLDFSLHQLARLDSEREERENFKNIIVVINDRAYIKLHRASSHNWDDCDNGIVEKTAWKLNFRAVRKHNTCWRVQHHEEK
jgi:hypothetical protein